MITLEEIYELYKEVENREMGETYIYDYKGKEIITDVGNPFDGIHFFIKAIEHKIEAQGDVQHAN